MTSLVAPDIPPQARYVRTFSPIYVAVLLFSLHAALVLYVGSSFISQFVSEQTIGILYTIGSILTLIAFYLSSALLRTYGNYRVTLWLSIIEIVALVGLAVTGSVYTAITFFIVHQTVVPVLALNLDIFTEHLIGTHENITGGKRGILLVILSVGGALATLGAGYILGGGAPRFTLLYIVGAGTMLAFHYCISKKFRAFRDPSYDGARMFLVIRHFWRAKNFRFVFLTHFLLQLFFAWMVIYIPFYLSRVIGLPWNHIGIILFVAMLAYVICEYPIGLIADKYIGEKEMMSAGFLILAITTAYIAFLKTPLLMPWMVTMFMTRLGASLVEVTTESYFFKHTRDANANVISFFRATRPLAYLLGALLGSAMLLFMPLHYTFFVLGVLMLPGVVFALFLRDTR